ncbi:hypothetical protein E2C01_004311 [Portunus trituberculatus]|uniref:Uncharacterized protein n=1 Tax=Portunus trituberculatus TaxID=210409 RepID=A0A5B7CS29_PORTR|nr:hypothetical protein [Portunus trituberculatus]
MSKNPVPPPPARLPAHPFACPNTALQPTPTLRPPTTATLSAMQGRLTNTLPKAPPPSPLPPALPAAPVVHLYGTKSSSSGTRECC